MAKKDVDQERVKISAPPPLESTIKQIDDVFIIITEAYCPNGHNLISDDNEEFDGYPGIKVFLKSDTNEGIVYLSPIHGDGTKKGNQDWKDGQKIQFFCPICNVPLPTFAKCHCSFESGQHGDLVKLFTSSDLSDSHILALCNVWGCRRSRTIDNWNIISEFLDGQITD